MTGHASLRPVSLHTRRDDLTGSYVVAYDDGRNAAFTIRRSSRQVSVATEHQRELRREPLAAATELGDLAMRARAASPVAAWSLPDGELESVTDPRRRPAQLFAALAQAVAVGLLALVAPALASLLFLALPATIGVTWAAMNRFRHAWVADGERIELWQPIVDADIEAADHIVADVKAEYGELLSDVVVRIECAALFDPTVPATRDFIAGLVAWDRDRERLTPGERKVAAAHLRVAFDAAVAHARAVGLDHIPEPHRGRASTASKAFRLAADESAPDTERESARARGTELLEAIPLHFLPTAEELRALEGGPARLALPGRLEDLA